MKIKNHIVTSLPLGTVYYIATGEILSAAIVVLSAVLVDVDHCLDYVVTQKSVSSLRKMIESFNTFEVINKNYFILHSWELIILFAIEIVFYPSSYLIAIFIGYAFHLLLDQIVNTRFQGKRNVKPFFYFFVYRMKYSFEVLPLRKEGMNIKADERIYFN